MTTCAPASRLEKLAAFLYGWRSVPGQPKWNELPAAAQRQWLELAGEALAVLA